MTAPFSHLARSLGLALMFGAGLFLTGCGLTKTKSQQEALKEIEWSFEETAIQFDIAALPQLNLADGQPHTLLLVAVQMADPGAFSIYTRDPDKLSSLLMSPTPPDGMLDLQRFFIEPGSQHRFEIPRLATARYVGVAAGFHQLSPLRSTRLYQVGVDYERKGLIFREYTAIPSPLGIKIRLGSDGILDSISRQAYPAVPERPQAGLVSPQGPFPAPILVAE